jgi:hypothetical protein
MGWGSNIKKSLFVSATLGALVELESTKLLTQFNIQFLISSFIKSYNIQNHPYILHLCFGIQTKKTVIYCCLDQCHLYKTALNLELFTVQTTLNLVLASEWKCRILQRSFLFYRLKGRLFQFSD